MLPRLQAAKTLRDIDVASFTSWSGKSSNRKIAASQGNRYRREYVAELRRQALGRTLQRTKDGTVLIRNAKDAIAYFASKDLGNVEA